MRFAGDQKTALSGDSLYIDFLVNTCVTKYKFHLNYPQANNQVELPNNTGMIDMKIFAIIEIQKHPDHISI